MRREWTPEDDARLADLRAAGRTLGAIARAMQRPYWSVVRRIRKLEWRRYTSEGVRTRMDVAEVAMDLEEALAALEARPHGTAYEDRISGIVAGLRDVLCEARAEEEGGRHG